MSESADQTQAMARDDLDRADGDGGLVLGGRYELTERIAKGGMAAVWRAYDDVLARTVAVKLLHGHLAADEAFRERFRREAIAAAKLTHPHVVSLYDTGVDGDHVYLVMEYVDGATLREVIGDLGSMAPGQAAAIGEKIARALDYAHERGLVHRDVKPANILLGDDGAVKVADFGIAKAEEHDGDLTKTGMVLGTAAYVAPEQITGAEPVDGRADQYALGCMLYEALTGTQPFKGETAVATAAQRLESSPTPLRSLRPDIPRGLDTIVMRAMARNPADRFVSLGAMADALAAFADPDTSHTAALPLATAHRATSLGRGSGAPARQRVAVSPPEPPAAESFLRTEGLWLLPVIVLFVVAGGLIAAGVSSGMFDASRLPGVGDQDDEPADDAAPVEAQPLDLTDAVAFDPQGDGGESDGQLSNLIDGDDATTWRTEIYNTAEFGGLKDGVGFYVDLGASQEITGAELLLAGSGLNFDVRVAEEVESAADDWQQIGSQARDASGTFTVDADEPVTGRYVLVWVTAPLPDDGGYKAEFAGITVLGAAEDDG